jgi:uncharacterized OB-fold protein
MDRPVPIADAISAPFWEAARERRLAIQHCATCATFQHPPGPICRRCSGSDLVFRDTSGRGTLYSFTASEVAFDERFEAALPLLIGVVELDEPGTCRLICNISSEHADFLRVDMPMRVVFEELADGTVLPQFEPAL